MSRKCANSILMVWISWALMTSTASDSVHDFSPHPREVERCMNDPTQCVEFSTYPSAHIEKLINNGAIKKEWFQQHEIRVQDEKMKTGLYDNGAEDDFHPLCDSYNIKQYPKGGITKDGEFIYVVQTKMNNVSYHQSIQQTGCSGKDKPCGVKDAYNNTIPFNETGVKFICEAEIIDTKVVGITKQGEVVHSEIKHYCCCVCKTDAR